jgi:hypothetical protein
MRRMRTSEGGIKIKKLVLLETMDGQPIWMSQEGEFSLIEDAKHPFRAEYVGHQLPGDSLEKFTARAEKQLGLEVQVEADPAPNRFGK